MAIAGWARTSDLSLPASDAPGCPVFSSKLMLLLSTSNITVPAAYATIFSYNGSGKFVGGVLDFNSDDIIVKLTIDGNIIFELDLDDVEDMQATGGGSSDSGSSSVGLLCGFIALLSGARFNMCFTHCPILYNSSVLIEAKRSGTDNKKLNRSLVTLTKET